jgi:SAM-dependent methyltransferase
MSTNDLHTTDVLAFVTSALGEHQRILEVGCGRGALARELAKRGHAVTALDIDLRELVDAPGVAFVERDFVDYDGGPFDVVLFTSSLHHIHELDRAVAKAAALAPLVVVDEFDLAAPDVATLRWYYGVQELLVAADAYPPDRLDHHHHHRPATTDVLARWEAGHAHEPPLHPASAMTAALAKHFTLQIARDLYLYRYIARSVTPRIAAHVKHAEERGIAEGWLAPVGVRIIGRALPAR